VVIVRTTTVFDKRDAEIRWSGGDGLGLPAAAIDLTWSASADFAGRTDLWGMPSPPR
jgi:hypothetical protein